MWSASSPYSTHVPGIEQQVEPLAHGQLAERPLPLDELLAAHAERLLLALSRGRRRAAPSRATSPPPVDVMASLLHALPALPLRGALLRERGDALGRVLR